MVSFKEIRNNDIKNILINANEFGTEHIINDDSVLIVLDSNINKERVFGSNTSSFEDGIYLNHLAFFVSESDLGYRPAENDHMTFDGVTGIVATCQDESGLLYIVLELNLS